LTPARYSASAPINGHRKTGPVGPFRADFVAKVMSENQGLALLSLAG
jgi:hypothetical protein